MTTRITVDAHAGWPVKVIRIDDATGNWVGEPVIVPPNEKRDFSVWQGSNLLIHECEPVKSKE